MTQPPVPFDFRILGPLEVWERGTRVEIRGARARALLTILLLNAGRSMVIGQLVEALWGDRPPRTARDSIQFFVHQIRRGLGPDAGTRLLRTTTSGYILEVAPEQLDSERFQQLLRQARAAHADGALERSWDCYTQGLGLWRGPALADVAGEAFAQPEIARLEELRLTVVEERLRTGIELGRQAELIGDAEALVGDQPLREQARALLMLALYRAGRQADALAVFRAGQAVSVEQLGIEPGPELRTLERRILAGDPTLLAPHATIPPAPASKAAADPVPASPAVRRPEPPDDASPTPPAADTEPPAEVAPRDERKQVTVLVASVAEADGGGDPEDVRGHTTAALERVTERVAHYGGVVQAAAMGRLLAVFGATRSQEDDPERAVRVGLEIRAAAAGGEATARIGIATGEVVVSAATPGDGPGGTGTTSVVGDVIHAATALSMSAPPGAVRVGAGTYRTTGRSIEYRRVEPTDPSQQALEQLTGVQVWEAVQPLGRTGAQVADRLDSPLIERNRELGLLTDVLNRFLRDGEPQLLTLISDPGLGKSRLVAELAQLADQASTLVSWRVGRSSAYGEGTFWALAEIVRDHANVLAGDPADVADAKLRTVTGSAVSDHDQAAVLESLRALLGPGTPRERTPELFAGWYLFVAALATQRPTVLVFEDLQWADESLLEFVAGLAEHVGPVPLLVVATGRPELLDRRAGWAGGQRNAVSLSLNPLTRDGTAALLDALLPGRPLPDETREALLTSAGGNPLYVEEYVRMLQERTAATLGDELTVPPTVQQLIAARLDSLPAEDKRLLQDAAVIGEVGWVGALATASGRDAAEVGEAVRRLERRGLLRRARVPSVARETEYVFRHALVRDVAYSQLLRGERSAQHLRVAEWIADLNPDPGERIDLLAHHYERALQLAQASGSASPDLAERTRRVLRAAGDHAFHLGAMSSAERSYRAALELWPVDAPDRPELLYQLGWAMIADLRGEAELLEARVGFDAAGDPTRAARATRQLALLARNRGEPDVAQAFLEEALEQDPNDETARVMAMAGQTLELAIRGYLVEAISFGPDVVAKAAELGLVEEEAYAVSGVARARLLTGDARGEAEFGRAIALLERARVPDVHITRWSLAQCLEVFGDLRRAREAASHGRDEAQRHHGSAAPHVLEWFDAVTAGADYGAGQWDAVEAAVTAALTAAAGVQRNPEPWVRPLRGRVRLGRGDPRGALEEAARARTAAQRVGELRMVQPCRALEARALVAAGRRDEAVACLDTLLAVQGQDPTAATVSPDQAAVMVELGYPADALPDGLWPTRWHLAVQQLVARDFDEAAQTLETIGSFADAATARLHLARALTEDGHAEAAEAALEPAVRFWRRAGASAYLAEAEALAATLTTPRGARGDRG